MTKCTQTLSSMIIYSTFEDIFVQLGVGDRCRRRGRPQFLLFCMYKIGGKEVVLVVCVCQARAEQATRSFISFFFFCLIIISFFFFLIENEIPIGRK